MIFLFLLMMTSAFAAPAPCGLQGTLDERIKECATAKGNFILVSRTVKGSEVYKDSKSGLIWGPRISYEFNHYGSSKACGDENPVSQIFKDLVWRLPTLKEFEQGAANGIKSSLSDMGHWFWTSTPVGKTKKKYRRRKAAPTSVFMWDGTEEVAGTGSLMDVGSVKCVTRD